MKKLGWYVMSAAVAAFVLGGGLLLAANLYVQSRVVQLRIRLALTASLRMPVSLQKTTFTPWDGLRIDGITARPDYKQISGDTATATSDSLSAASFRVYFAFLPLLHRQFVARDVLLDRPNLVWAQDTQNRWHLPAQKPSGSEGGATPPPASSPSPGVGTPLPAGGTAASPSQDHSPPPTVAEPPEPPAARSPRNHFAVEKFRLRHGDFDFLNHRRGRLGRFDEVDVDGHLDGNEQASGFATVGMVNLPRFGLKLTRFSSHFAYGQAAGLSLDDARADLAGGLLSADYHMQTGVSGSPFTATCRLDNVGLGELIKDAGGKHRFVDARLQGSLNVSGGLDDPAQCSATGHLQLNDTEIHDFPLFQAVGDILRINDLQHLRFKKAQLDYEFDGTNLQIKPLYLASNDVQITVQGRYVVRDDRLNLQARLVVDDLLYQRLPRFVSQQFTVDDPNAPDSRYIDFKVNGPLNKPFSDLYQRLLPSSLNGLLDDFLRPHPKRAKHRPVLPDDDPSPPTDPEPTPEPQTP